MADVRPAIRARLTRAGVAAALVVALPGCPSRAEAAPTVAPSQVTPATLAPSPAAPAAGLAPPATTPISAPPGAERLVFRVRRLRLEGAFPELAEAGEALAKPLQNRKISVAELYRLADAVAKLYADAGYPLARVTVPAQKLSEGSDATLQVTDGFIEALSLTGLPASARPAVAARLHALVGKRRLRYAELERAVLLAGDVAGLRLRSALARGRTPGGVVLALEGEAQWASASVATDNNLPISLGGWEFNTRLALNNAFGFGEQAYLSFASGYAMGLGGFPMSPLRTIGFGVVAPLGVDGWTLTPEVTQSLTRPAPAAGAPETVGKFERFALRGAFPIERGHDRNLTLSAALEVDDQQIFTPLQGGDLSHDRYAALRAGAAWQGDAVWGGVLQADAQVSQGLGGYAAHLSRQGAAPNFTKLTADARLDRGVLDDTQLELSARAQAAFRPQMTSEQFALDGANAVSAFTQGAFSVDSGETLRLEASRRFALPCACGALTLSPYVFAAQGYGVVLQPTAAEQARIAAAAFGLGARLAFSGADGVTGLDFSAELGRGLSNVAAQKAGYRAAITASLHY